MTQQKYSVAIVGRPNVGKSRLFNRLLGRRVSIVHDKPGVTRDIVAESLGANILLMDTGGMFSIPEKSEQVIGDATTKQANFAIMAADAILFVVDSQGGLLPLDFEIASILRSSGKKVMLLVNKIDVPQHIERAAEFHSLGFKNFAEVSAEHGTGFEKVFSFLEANFGKIDQTLRDEGDDRIKISVAGRPNVGKSSILNRLLGEERFIVSPIAGTTRDSVKCDIDAVSKKGEDMHFRFFDTAGLRTKRKINTSLDFLSSNRSRAAINKSDVVFLVIDSMEGVTELDKRLAGDILEAGASIILVVNKWDYATATFASGELQGYKNIREFGKKFEEAVRNAIPQLADAPIFFTSALQNKGLDKLLEAAYRVYGKMNLSVSTGKLNSVIRKVIDSNPPKHVSGKRFKVYYCVKIGSRPWTVRVYCNSATALAETYRRYLVNTLRKELKLGGVAIKLELVGKTSQSLQERLAK